MVEKSTGCGSLVVGCMNFGKLAVGEGSMNWRKLELSSRRRVLAHRSR